MNNSLIDYYKQRASEYEKIYSKPERQDDLKKAENILRPLFKNKSVLEIACGTGHWTERLFKDAASVYATDVNEAVVEIARRKNYLNLPIKFEVADLYNLSRNTKYDCVFGGFIWSHIPLQELDKFINTVNNLVLPGGQVIFIDNIYVHGSNHPITETDEKGNTFQARKLDNGTIHRVLKNFPDEAFLRQKLSGLASKIQVINLEYYWILIYTTI